METKDLYIQLKEKYKKIILNTEPETFSIPFNLDNFETCLSINALSEEFNFLSFISEDTPDILVNAKSIIFITFK